MKDQRLGRPGLVKRKVEETLSSFKARSARWVSDSDDRGALPLTALDSLMQVAMQVALPRGICMKMEQWSKMRGHGQVPSQRILVLCLEERSTRTIFTGSRLSPMPSTKEAGRNTNEVIDPSSVGLLAFSCMRG